MTREHFSDPGKESRAAAGIPVIPALDGFRAGAIFAIVMAHVLLFSGAAYRITGTSIGDAALLLPLGVDALFIISGFVVFLPTVVAGGRFGSVRDYAMRRAARLAPAYWLVIALLAILIAVAPVSSGVFIAGPRDLPMPSLTEFVAHVFYLQGPIQFVDLEYLGLGIDGPLWTLSLEIIFYLVLPFVAAAYFRRPLLGLAIAAGISVTWHYGFGHIGAIADALGLDVTPERLATLAFASDYQFPGFAFSFGVGMTAAWGYVKWVRELDRTVIERRAALVQLLALASVAFSVYLCNRYGVRATQGAGAAAIGRFSPPSALIYNASLGAFILATALAPRRRQWLVSNRVARWLADNSYGVYLIHYPLLAYALYLFAPPQTGTLGAVAIWVAIVVPSTITYGYLSARFVEQPVRRWARRYGRRADHAGEPAGASDS